MRNRTAIDPIAWLAVVVVAMSVITLAPAASATAPGPNGRLLYSRFARHCGDSSCASIVTIDPDGTDAVHLTGLDGASWSPDGSQLSSAAQTDDGRIATMIVDADGSNPVLFPIQDPTLNTPCGVWTPDASRLFCEGWDDVHQHRRAGIFSVDATDGTDLVRVTRNPFGGHDLPFDTSPNGQRVVFFREDPARRHRNLALMRVDADGSNLMKIGPWIAEQYCCTASWSPDGTTILTSNKGLFLVVAASGSSVTRMDVDVDEDHFLFGPDWSPDGTRIAFDMATVSTQKFDIYTAAADGTDVERVTDARGFVKNPDWGSAPVVGGS
jgi:Tol biopolymer transport system component